ncbi:FlxA-like family protein [Lachnospiraceae bacterium CLA-AA-H185]|jgi:hypothetical protein|uniref:FlxA-like family protein n=1 Tax=Maccoyibacter intestinihominis TaxID=3133499 RepID=A0ABV1HCQ4_9FIRM
MRINVTDRTGAAQAGTTLRNGGMQSDSYTKNIQRQIADAQQKLQDLSSNEELSLEDKMKKRQEIQQEITNLNQQLRQHQMEQRREQQSQKSSSMDDMIAGTKHTSAKKGTGLSQASMQAIISADTSMKQANVQGSVAAGLKGRAEVLESEIRQDAGKGNTEKKEQELADIQGKVQSATAQQMSMVARANQEVEEAAKVDSAENTEKTESADKTNNTNKTGNADRTDNVDKIENANKVGNTDRAEKEKQKTESSDMVESSAKPNEQSATEQVGYKPIDVKL